MRGEARLARDMADGEKAIVGTNSDIQVARGEFFPSEPTLANYSKIWTTVGLGQCH